MASSNGSEKSTTPSERLGAVFANVLQEQLLDGTDNVAQTATSNAQALYTDKRRIDFIPCLLEKGYEPKGWLGILIRDKLYIDFSSSDNFDMVFEELVAEIQVIADRLQISPTQTCISSPVDNTQSTIVMSTSTTITSANNRVHYDCLRAVIRDFRESIQQNNHDTQSMTEEEFSQFVNYIRQRVFTNTSSLSQTETNNTREILQELLRHSQNQTEFMRRITEILSSLTETRMIIKLSLAFAFVWTLNKFLTHK
ncbi:unnamed protein product [Rotaria sp. Silwood1]|nr:unnamed protein product [Rotaria sp. Silwood1]